MTLRLCDLRNFRPIKNPLTNTCAVGDGVEIVMHNVGFHLTNRRAKKNPPTIACMVGQEHLLRLALLFMHLSFQFLTNS